MRMEAHIGPEGGRFTDEFSPWKETEKVLGPVGRRSFRGPLSNPALSAAVMGSA